MGPRLTAVQRATQLFRTPAVREQVRGWHDANVPLIDMVERLGIGDMVDDDLRTAITSLKPEEVALIRAAFVAEIDRAGDSSDPEFPVDCDIDDVRGPVRVSSIDIDGRPGVKVVPT